MPPEFVHLLTPSRAGAALVAVNVLAFTSFGLDKVQAQRGMRRTRESTLLWLAFLGGTPGAYVGRSAFRHKTRRQPFSSQLHAIATTQVVGLGLGLGWWLGG